LKDLPVTERRLEVAGVSTSLLEGGEGPSIVLLHGQGNFAAAWMTVIPDLVSTYHVIAHDLPSLGASEVPEGPLEANAVLVWLSELIDHTCATPPAVVVGISLGDQFATRFAALHSEQVVRLVIVDTPGLVGEVRPAPGACSRSTVTAPIQASTPPRSCCDTTRSIPRACGSRWVSAGSRL